MSEKTEENDSNVIVIAHPPAAGFFSCCSKILYTLIENINKGIIPKKINTANMFYIYKKNLDKNFTDIRNRFFKEPQTYDISYNIPIIFSPTDIDHQFSDYSLINYSSLTPLINQYFQPSDVISNTINYYNIKYEINPENICVIRYRGTDKNTETILPVYSEFIEKAKQIQMDNPGIRFFVLTDETEFLNECLSKLSNVFYISEMATISSKYGKGVHNSGLVNGEKDIFYFLAAVYIASKCKYIITTSGNVDMWIQLFRGHNKGVLQYINHKEYIYGTKNTIYTGTGQWYINT